MTAPYRSLALFVLTGALLWAQTDAAGTPPAAAQPSSPAPPTLEELPLERAPVVVPLNEDRILKIIPDYQTVENSRQDVAPMTAKEKWNLAWKELIDPFNIASAGLGAAMSQGDNETPKYGHGARALGERFGAAIGDFGSQNVFSAGVFATLLHQDPRYFRRGPPSGFFARVADSLKQIVITRQDSGRHAFNASNFLGMAAGIGLSNVYYPSASRTGTVMASRVATSLTGDVMGNLMSEFWPDIEKKFFRKKQKN